MRSASRLQRKILESRLLTTVAIGGLAATMVGVYGLLRLGPTLRLLGIMAAAFLISVSVFYVRSRGEPREM
jgi:hypothetical protein